MPVRPEESLDKMVASLKEKTGKSLDEWRSVIAGKGLAKHGEIMTFLKGECGISHGFSNQIALRSRPSDVAEAHAEDPVAAMFVKKEASKPIYDGVVAALTGFGEDVDFAPKKGYMSVRRSKQFAILQPAASRLDVGIQLKGVESSGRLEASGGFNAMLTHRVRVGSVDEVDSELIAWLKQAYEAA